MNEAPKPMGTLQSVAAVMAGTYFAIAAGMALLKLGLYGELRFPVSRFHGMTVVYYVDEPLRTAIWAGATVLLGIGGIWVAHIGWTGLRSRWRS